MYVTIYNQVCNIEPCLLPCIVSDQTDCHSYSVEHMTPFSWAQVNTWYRSKLQVHTWYISFSHAFHMVSNFTDTDHQSQFHRYRSSKPISATDHFTWSQIFRNITHIVPTWSQHYKYQIVSNFTITNLKWSKIIALQISNCLKPTTKDQVQKHNASIYYTNIWHIHVRRTTPSSVLLRNFLLQHQVVVTLPRHNFIDVYAHDPLFLLKLLGSS
jgi:hypothetical protein